MTQAIFSEDIKTVKTKGKYISRVTIIPFALLVSIFLIRLLSVYQNTIFFDEAVNVTLGIESLAGDFTKNATAWTFGSYLYPRLAGLSFLVGDDLGVRILTALLSTLTAGTVYATTRILFSHDAGIWALLLFGFGSAGISLGQLAVYDTLSIPLMAMAILGVIKASVEKDGYRTNSFLVLAAIAASLSILTKYIGLLFLPALGFVALGNIIRHKRSLKPIIIWFCIPLVLILVGYFLLNQASLLTMLQQYENQLYVYSERGQIVHTIFVESGFLLCGALLGILFILINRDDRQSSTDGFLFCGFFLLLIVLAYIVPIYQIVSQNIQSLWKHTVYSSLYLAPLAGYAFSYVVFRLRHYRGRREQLVRLIGMLAMLTILIWYVDNALDRNWGFLHSWPNVSGAISFLEEYGIDRETRLLAEESAVYEYYFDFGANDRDVWSSTFYLDYRGLADLEAMQQGIRDGYFDLVILDDYYTKEKNVSIRQSLDDYDYTLVYQDSEPQQLSTGQSISIQIYARR